MTTLEDRINSGEKFGKRINGDEIFFNAPANWNHFNIFCTGKFAKVKAPKGADYRKLDSLMNRDGHGGWKISRDQIRNIIPQLGGRVYLDIAASVAYLEG